VLAWLSVCSEVQTCIWPSWCHCHSLVSNFSEIQIGFTFLVLANLGCPRKRAVKQVCVCWWQVILSDPTWHASSRGGEVANCYIQLLSSSPQFSSSICSAKRAFREKWHRCLQITCPQPTCYPTNSVKGLKRIQSPNQQPSILFHSSEVLQDTVYFNFRTGNKIVLILNNRITKVWYACQQQKWWQIKNVSPNGFGNANRCTKCKLLSFIHYKDTKPNIAFDLGGHIWLLGINRESDLDGCSRLHLYAFWLNLVKSNENYSNPTTICEQCSYSTAHVHMKYLIKKGIEKRKQRRSAHFCCDPGTLR